MKSCLNEILELFEEFGESNVLAFAFLKVIDETLKYSKEDIIAQYNLYDETDDEKLFDVACYPSGKNLGFYNYSDWDLDKLSDVDENLIHQKTKIYLNSFNPEVKDLFSQFDIFNFIDDLSDEDLYILINDLNEINVDGEIFKSYEHLNNEFNLFLNDFNSYFDISNYNSFVNSLLTNISVESDNNFNVYFDSFDDGLIINDVINKFPQVHIDACEPNHEKFLIASTRMILAGLKSSHITNDINLNKDNFDLIISNKIHQNADEIVNDSYKQLKNSSKVIITIKSEYVNDVVNTISNSGAGDIIESVIYLPIYENNNVAAIVLNNNKDYALENKFKLSNESDYLNGLKNISDWKFIISNLSKHILESKNSKIIKYEPMHKKDLSRKHMLSNKIGKFEEIDLDNLDLDEYEKGLDKELMRNKVNIKKNRVNSKDVNSSLPSDTPNVVPSQNTNYLDVNELNLEINRPDLSNVYDGDFEILNLSQIANLEKFNYDDKDENYLVISASTACGIQLVDFEVEYDNREYIKIDITSDLILKDYLKIYLNSAIGINEINYCTRADSRITTTNLEDVRVIVPGINDQNAIVEAYNESDIFFNSINELQNKLNNNIFDYEKVLNSIDEFNTEIVFNEDGSGIEDMDKQWREVFSRLIWPLAITYLSATKGSFEKTEQVKKYLNLFEFIAAFNSIVLRSGLPDDVYHEFKWSQIWNAPHVGMYKDMTFGNWVFLSNNLSKLYRWNDFPVEFDKNLFTKISSRKINNLLNETKEIRNKYYHENLSYQESVEILDKLNKYLSDTFQILTIYSDYKLFYFTGHLELKNGIFDHRVINLNGPCNQPIYGNIEFSNPLEESELYLYNSSTGDLLKLRNELIKFKAVDKYEKRWAIYIFNGYAFENGKCLAKYKNFIDGEDNLEIEINSFENDIVR